MKISVSRTVVSILGEGLEIEGDVISDGEVCVFGTLKGNVTARKLVLGRHGTIDGRIEAEGVFIDGTFSGSLLSKTIFIGQTASVTADITYVSMEIRSGAIHNGRATQVDRVDAVATDNVREFSVPRRAEVLSGRTMPAI